MTNEILEKIRKIINKPSLSEADVQHLFNLSRKLIEQLPRADKSNFALLKFYCDWTVHSKIDKSAEGAMIIERVHTIVNDHMGNKDNSLMPAELTTALSLDEAKSQLNNLLRVSGQEGDRLSIDDNQWRPIKIHLVEVVSNCPLRIDVSKKWLKSISDKMTPIKGRFVVEEVAVIKIPRKTLYPAAGQDELIYCIRLTLSDTTCIIAPLVSNSI